MHAAQFKDKGKGKGVGFKSWSQAGSHDFTILNFTTRCHVLYAVDIEGPFPI